MAASAPMMTVLHVETGHVLAAITAGSAAPAVEDLTGGAYLSVRVPGHDPVRVPPGLLTAVRVPRQDGVLDDPRSYQVLDGQPAWLGPPRPLSTSVSLGAEGVSCLSLWQVGNQLVEIRTTLDAGGKPLVGKPPGADGGLVLCKGVALATAP
jgi:hypothetical protein